jgi:hypothetical protein
MKMFNSESSRSGNRTSTLVSGLMAMEQFIPVALIFFINDLIFSESTVS